MSDEKDKDKDKDKEHGHEVEIHGKKFFFDKDSDTLSRLVHEWGKHSKLALERMTNDVHRGHNQTLNIGNGVSVKKVGEHKYEVKHLL